MLFAANSCKSAKMDKMLLYHSAQMEQLANKKMPPSQKIDVLAALAVEALEESLQFSKTKESVKFLKQYTSQNKSSVDRIYKEVESWYLGLSVSEKLIETARIATKPYVRQLLNLMPKVETKLKRKLKPIFFISKFVNLLKI